MKKQDLALHNFKGWYAIKSNQTISFLFNIYEKTGFGIK